ncbi:hypothetical protein ACDA63_07245 [Uliginosibacterium sp. sgz301328]|uniref:hypothetical protein n=1 Tax=Uliginosibacterium sp. sgz301328 TaxID=3243764 RepID=UPI00359E45CA
MAAPKGRPRPAGSGRQKGTTNKATADIKALAQKHGPEAIKTLLDLMQTSESDQARIAAAKELLDRGFGKATQAIEASGPGGVPLTPPVINVTFGEQGDGEAG